MRSPRQGHLALSVIAAVAALVLVAAPAIAAGPSAVRGGGVVGGDRGVTSQLGFTASERGGSFLCVMAGRSGGFAFGPWDTILQMQVQGRVTPGSLEIAGEWSSFDGVADIHVVGIADGEVLAVKLTDIPFTSRQTSGGALEAQHVLEVDLPGPNLVIGPEYLTAGRITISE
ncbi:MAG: hypothetical protein ACRDGJ_09140 [Candidatus Limnocylindria bacterium]